MTALVLTLAVLVVGIPLLIWADRDAQLDNMMSPEWVARQQKLVDGGWVQGAGYLYRDESHDMGVDAFERFESMLRHPAGKGK